MELDVPQMPNSGLSPLCPCLCVFNVFLGMHVCMYVYVLHAWFVHCGYYCQYIYNNTTNAGVVPDDAVDALSCIDIVAKFTDEQYKLLINQLQDV